MVGPDAGLRIHQPDPSNAREPLAVALLDLPPLRDLPVQVAQVAHAHGGAELVHLGVPADILYVLRRGDPEVLPLVEHRVERRVLEADGTPLDGVEDLGGVEAEHGRVAKACDGDAVPLHSEGMGRIVDHLEAVSVRDPLDRVHVAEVAVDMHGDDRAGSRRDQPLHAFGVDGVVVGLHVGEDGRESLPDDGVGGRGEGVRGRDDLAPEVERLQDALQRVVPVGEQGDVLDPETLFQRRLELPVLGAHVREPVGLPEGPYLLHVLLERGHGGPGDQDPAIHLSRFLPLYGQCYRMGHAPLVRLSGTDASPVEGLLGGPKKVGELLYLEQGRQAHVDCGERQRLERDRGGGGQSEEADEGGGSGRHCCEEKGGADVSHLLAVGVADDPTVRPSVHEGRDNISHEVARNHEPDVAQDERAEQDRRNAVGLLHELELEEEVAPPHAVEGLEVGGVYGQQRVDEAVDLHEPDRVAPLLPQKEGHERGRHNGEERHRGGDEEGRGLEGAPHEALHLGPVVLHSRDCREHDGLDCPVEEVADSLRVLLALGDVPEARRRELTTDDEVGEALVPLLEEPGSEEPRAEPEEPPRARPRELETRAPVELDRVREAVRDLVGELLRDERPHPEPRDSAHDAEDGGDEAGEDGSVEDLPHLEPAGDERDLHSVVGVDDEEQRQGAKRPDEAGHGVEGRYPRGSDVDDEV